LIEHKFVQLAAREQSLPDHQPQPSSPCAPKLKPRADHIAPEVASSHTVMFENIARVDRVVTLTRQSTRSVPFPGQDRIVINSVWHRPLRADNPPQLRQSDRATGPVRRNVRNNRRSPRTVSAIKSDPYRLAGAVDAMSPPPAKNDYPRRHRSG